MLEKLLSLLKKRFADLILIVAVIAVFFLTGKKTTHEIETTKPENVSQIESPVVNVQVNLPAGGEVPNPIQPDSKFTQNPNIPNAQTPQPESKTSDQENRNFQNPSNPQMNPNHNIFPSSSPNNLGDSLKNLKGKSASTEDIVNRNAYFQKLSKQLNELQGDASSEGSGDLPNGEAGTGNPESNHSDNYPQDEIPIQTEENYMGIDESGQNQLYPQEQFNENNMENPYGELNRFPPPVISQ